MKLIQIEYSRILKNESEKRLKLVNNHLRRLGLKEYSDGEYKKMYDFMRLMRIRLYRILQNGNKNKTKEAQQSE